MVEVLWVTLFGAGLAWLQSRNSLEEAEVKVPVDDEWTRWEEEIHDWRDS
ncbi:hypothetical protein [Euzebya sp.]